MSQSGLKSTSTELGREFKGHPLRFPVRRGSSFLRRGTPTTGTRGGRGTRPPPHIEGPTPPAPGVDGTPALLPTSRAPHHRHQGWTGQPPSFPCEECPTTVKGWTRHQEWTRRPLVEEKRGHPDVHLPRPGTSREGPRRGEQRGFRPPPDPTRT